LKSLLIPSTVRISVHSNDVHASKFPLKFLQKNPSDTHRLLLNNEENVYSCIST